MIYIFFLQLKIKFEYSIERWLLRKSLPVRTEMRCAIMRPPITAKPVQSECPKIPPTMTPYTLSRAAKMMVANCDRSPHSAKNVIENAWMRTRIIIDLLLLVLGLRVGVGMSVVITSICGFSVTVTTPRSMSGKRVVDVAVSFSNFWKNWTKKKGTNNHHLLKYWHKEQFLGGFDQFEIWSIITSSSRFFKSDCTSSNSSCASFGDIYQPSRSIFKPNIANSAVEI